jgi:1,4-alpha-glucan branching enzyme
MKQFLPLFLVLWFASCKEQPPCCDPDPTPIDTTGTSSGDGYQQYGTPFATVPAAEEVVMYEVNPLVFSSTRDLPGVTARLDSIKSLGVNVVWLMPIYEKGSTNSVGSPYCIKDYKTMNPDYGDLQDLRDLVDASHNLGMAVMLDWVANHTSWDHIWMADESYYVKENGVIIHPPGTNWADVAELNYSNAEMRAEMISAMKYWTLEANVDGFRCDYATGVPGWFWKEAIDTLRSLPNRELLMFAESDDLSLLNQGFDMAFSWSFYGAALGAFGGGDARQLYTAHASEFYGLDPGKTMVRFVTNHDQNAWDNTPQNLFGGQNQVMSAFVLSCTMGGVPLLYNGQEKALPYKLPFFTPTSVAINWTLNPKVTSEYRSILSAYNDYDALRGHVRTNLSNFAIAAFTAVGSDHNAFVAVNTKSTAKSFAVPADWQSTMAYNPISKDSIALGTSLTLAPFEYNVFVK